MDAVLATFFLLRQIVKGGTGVFDLTVLDLILQFFEHVQRVVSV